MFKLHIVSHKRELTYIFAALCLFCLIFNVGCSLNRNEFHESSNIGIIETKNDSEESRLIIYDAELNKADEWNIAGKSLNSIFYNPVMYGGYLYLVPKTSKEVLAVDLKSQVVSSCFIGQPAINAVAANSEYLYTCNTLNATSFITRYCFNTKQTVTVELNNLYTSFLLVSDDKIYAFSSSLDNEHSQIDCFDEDLNLLETLDSTSLGMGVYQAVEYEENIYFTCLYAPEHNNTSMLGLLKTDSRKLEQIELTVENPFGVVRDQETLAVSHYDVVDRPDESFVTLIDLNTADKTTHFLNHGAEQMTLVDKKLYVLSKGALYCYEIDDWVLAKKIDLAPMDNEFSYITGIFHF